MPDYTFTIQVNNEDTEVFMSYGMLDEICRHCGGDPDAALMLPIDDDLRQATLKTLLSDRNEKGKITKEFESFGSKIDPIQAGELLVWAGAHALDFFLVQLEKMQKVGEARKDRLQALQSSLSGGKD